jgi:hypothetical protein
MSLQADSTASAQARPQFAEFAEPLRSKFSRAPGSGDRRRARSSRVTRREVVAIPPNHHCGMYEARPSNFRIACAEEDQIEI